MKRLTHFVVTFVAADSPLAGQGQDYALGGPVLLEKDKWRTSFAKLRNWF
jgi:hypothetical protein